MLSLCQHRGEQKYSFKENKAGFSSEESREINWRKGNNEFINRVLELQVSHMMFQRSHDNARQRLSTC